jgi:hypothetical protein
MKAWQRELLLWLLASPVMLVVAVVRAWRGARFLRAAMRPTLPCRTCGDQIALLGMWRCSCGFSYQGHLLRSCPVCKTLPQVVRCYRCNTTQKVRR